MSGAGRSRYETWRAYAAAVCSITRDPAFEDHRWARMMTESMQAAVAGLSYERAATLDGKLRALIAQNLDLSPQLQRFPVSPADPGPPPAVGS